MGIKGIALRSILAHFLEQCLPERSLDVPELVAPNGLRRAGDQAVDNRAAQRNIDLPQQVRGNRLESTASVNYNVWPAGFAKLSITNKGQGIRPFLGAEARIGYGFEV